MKTKTLILVAALALSGTGTAKAAVIDTSADWTGQVNDLWVDSAQTLFFTTDTVLNTFGWWLGQSHTHRVSVVEWASGPGTVLYTTTQAWVEGFNQIAPNTVLSGGTQYAVLFEYLGSIEKTVHYNTSSGYADGSWWLLYSATDPWADWSHLDMRFVATVSGYIAVPEPGTLVLLGFGLVGMGLRRRRRK